jgi:hypothetical protein
MVFHGINQFCGASEIQLDGGHVRVQRIAHGVVYKWFPIFCAENEVDMQFAQGLWHRLNRPFRAFSFGC